MFKARNKGKFEKGFTLIDLMVAMGLGGVAVATTIAIVNQAGRVRREENLHTSLLAIRMNIYNILQSYNDFMATLYYAGNSGAPANFLCLRTGTCPTAQTGINFALVYSKYGIAKPGGLITPFPYYDPTPATVGAREGFDSEGMRCRDPANDAPTAVCPIRVNLSWRNRCAAAACSPSFIEITVNFEYYQPHASNVAQRVRGTAYDFKLIKSVYPSSVGPTW